MRWLPYRPFRTPPVNDLRTWGLHTFYLPSWPLLWHSQERPLNASEAAPGFPGRASPPAEGRWATARRGAWFATERQRACLADELCRLAAPLCTQAGLARATGSVVRLAHLPGALLLRTRCAAVLLAAVADTTPRSVAGRRRGAASRPDVAPWRDLKSACANRRLVPDLFRCVHRNPDKKNYGGWIVRSSALFRKAIL